ncbi:MAG TPA: M14 family metallopeptidase [Actinomycetota bacterium]|nr:M14 family metallopeptidase [Actinomycetota bacterium]
MSLKSRSFVAALVALLVMAFMPLGRTDTARPTLVRVFVESAEQAGYLLSSFDETHNHSHGEVELLLWPGDLARLDLLGLDYEVVFEDLSARDAALEAASPNELIRLPGPDRTDYRRLADYNAELEELAKKNPRLVQLFKMKQPSLEGRTIYGVEIASDVRDQATDGRPIFYMDGIHHAREWPAAEYTQLFIYHLVENYGKDREITSLLRKARVIMVPIVNPDGFNYSREALAQNPNLHAVNGFEGYWRKNRRSLTGVTVPEAQTNPDAYGVDNNRNYSYLWGDSQGGSSGIQFETTYRGAAPFSEPENQNVRDIILGRNVVGDITNHTYQATVLRAGGGKAPEDKLLSAIGQKMADILGYKSVPSVGYPTTGTTDDWAYAATAALGFTIEHGSIGFHPPYADEVGAFWKQHMEAFEVMLDVVANPRYHSVLKGKVPGGPAKLTITKTFNTPLSPGNPTGQESVEEKITLKLRTANDGSFEWHLNPSDRPYEKKSESYTLTIDSGSKSKTMQVHLNRGQVLDLGNIKL